MTGSYPVDVIYLAACLYDTRLARICVASIRYFYPDVPITILPGDVLPAVFTDELKTYWNVGVAELPPGKYGWGMVKLEPLFGAPGKRFMVVDADTVFTGKVLDRLTQRNAPFIVDDEKFDAVKARSLYYEWDKVCEIDPGAPTTMGTFNSGQWFGTSGIIGRDAFDSFVEWTLPRQLRRPDLFKCGDQGVMNYIFLKKEAVEGLEIERRTIMRWPGHSMDGLDLESVKNGRAPALVVHWAGMKTMFLRDMVGAELLQFFEDFYFAKLPAGRLRWTFAICQHLWLKLRFEIGRRIQLRLQIWFGLRPRVSSILVKPTMP